MDGWVSREQTTTIADGMWRKPTRSQAEGHLLGHDLDDVILGQTFGTEGSVLQDKDTTAGVLDEARVTPPILQVLYEITPRRQRLPLPEILKDEKKNPCTYFDS